ncbi:MAG: ATP-binding protein [Bacteroidota bacterium]
MERELVIGRIIKEFSERKEEIVERDLAIPSSPELKKAITIVGPRRSGKTYLLLSYFQKIHNAPKIFFPLDDDRIYPPALNDLDISLKVLKELYPDATGRLCMFFDEIQEVPKWELFVKRVVERENASVYITGSSSKLLSKEIASELRGRTISYELFPFNFKEIMRINKLRIEKFITTSEESKIKILVKDYLTFGGFPEIVLKEEKRKILAEYANIMFYRDFVERYKIKNLKVARVFFNLLFNSFAKEISVNKIYHFMKSQGIKTSRNMLYNYLDYLHDAYLIFPLRKFSYSLKETEQSIPKMYSIDNGLNGVFNTDFQDSIGRLMENAVFIEMRKNGLVENKNIFYYKTADGKETDFAIREGSHFRQLIQVCYDLSDIGTKEREIKGILKASEELKCNNLLIITWDYEGEEKVDGKKIAYLPLWKWLLK